MWILKILPDAVFYFILLAGLAGIAASFVLKFIPFVAQYRVPIQWAAGIMTAFGLYMVGAIADNNAWLARVKELEHKVELAEQKSKAAAERLNDEVKRNKENAKSTTAAIKQDIARNSRQIDAECRVSDAAIDIHNQAAQNKKPSVTVTLDGKVTTK